MQGLTLKTLKLIDIFFTECEKSIVMPLLINECGNDLPFCEKYTAIELERIRFAVIKLSDGNLVKMKSFIKMAKTDWRDLLMIADFADESTAHDVWANSIIGGELNVESKKSISQNQKESAIDCPVCGKFKIDSEYNICEICFWEYDPSQYDNPTMAGGANNLSINDYIIWWSKLGEIMPSLMKKHQVVTSKRALWTFDEMIVPRKHIKDFVRSISQHDIAIRVSFYNICEKYGYNSTSFVGYPYVYEETIESANEKSLEIIFCDNPIRTCEQYNLKQVLEILNKSEDKIKTWKELTPNISIKPNPRSIPKN